MSISSNTTKAMKAGRRTRPPLNPADLIRSNIEALGKSVNEVAEEIGMSRSGLGLVVNKKRDLTAATALRLAHYFGTGTKGARLMLELLIDLRLHEAAAEIGGDLKLIRPHRLAKSK